MRLLAFLAALLTSSASLLSLALVGCTLIGYALIGCALIGCASATLSDTSAIEEYPNRAATKGEAGKLKYCLEGIHKIQADLYKKNHKFYTKASQLPADEYCSGLIVTMKMHEGGYLAFAQINEGDTTVKWSINALGKMIEYTDPDMDQDLF